VNMKRKVCATKAAGVLAKQIGFFSNFSNMAEDVWSVTARQPATPTGSIIMVSCVSKKRIHQKGIAYKMDQFWVHLRQRIVECTIGTNY